MFRVGGGDILNVSKEKQTSSHHRLWTKVIKRDVKNNSIYNIWLYIGFYRYTDPKRYLLI